MHPSKIMSCFVLATLMASTGGLAGLSQSPGGAPVSHTAMTVDFSPPAVTERGAYVTVTVPEADRVLSAAGKPGLPVYTARLPLPLGAEIQRVACTPVGVSTMPVEHHVAPAPHPVPLAGGVSSPGSLNQTIYGSEAPYPQTWYTEQAFGGLHNGKLATVVVLHLHPVRYLPAQHLLQYASRLRISVTFKEPSEPRRLGTGGDLLIVTPEEYTDELQPLVSHKESRGISTVVKTVEDITAAYPGADSQECVKYCIKDTVEQQGVTSVLLVGGEDKCPVRYTHVSIEEHNDREIFPTDLYYADLYTAAGNFSSWDTNHNGVFGEYRWAGRTDHVDLYPDVYVGRIPVENEKQVTQVVTKIVSYENGGTQDWFTNLVVCGGDSFTDDYGDTSGVNEGERVNQHIMEIMQGFHPVKIWASNGQVYRKANIDSAIQAGAGFVEFSGHGNPSLWATHPHNGSKYNWIPRPRGYTASDVRDLSHPGRLPVVITGACSTSKYTEQADCFGWSWVANPDGGAIASCGCTGLAYMYPGRYVTSGLVGKMETETFASYAGEEAETFGEIWGMTVSSYVGPGMDAPGYKTVEEWQPFGDPSLQLPLPFPTNDPPQKPSPPEGPTEGKKRKEYTYTASAVDPDGDQLYYKFDWGNGEQSSWLGPSPSGEPVNASYRWGERGEFEIKVKAKDTEGLESPWSDPLRVSMPLARSTAVQQIRMFLRAFLAFLCPGFQV